MNLEHYDREVRRARAVMKGLNIKPYNIRIDNTATAIQTEYNSDVVQKLIRWKWQHELTKYGFTSFEKRNLNIVLT